MRLKRGHSTSKKDQRLVNSDAHEPVVVKRKYPSVIQERLHTAGINVVCYFRAYRRARSVVSCVKDIPLHAVSTSFKSPVRRASTLSAGLFSDKSVRLDNRTFQSAFRKMNCQNLRTIVRFVVIVKIFGPSSDSWSPSQNVLLSKSKA